MKFLLDKKQALWVEEAYGEDLVYIFLTGPCRHLRSWKQVLNPSSLFYACYLGLDILKKYGDWQDPRALQKMKYLPAEIYDELDPKYAEEEAEPFHRDVFLVVLTLCELLRVTKDDTLSYIADGVYGWITELEDKASDNYRTKLMQLASEIVQEYTRQSPMLIVANKMEREGAIHHSGEVNIISYVRNYLNSERRISDEIKELLRNNGDRSKVKGLAEESAMQTEAASDGVSKEEAERLEARVKELEGQLEEKEREIAAIMEGKSLAESGTPIRIAKGMKAKTIVLLAAMFYAKFFESTDKKLTNRDHYLNAILQYGFGEKEQKSLRQTLYNYEDRVGKMDGLKQDLRQAVDDAEEDMSGKTDGLKQDFRQAVDDALDELKSFQNEEKFPAKSHQGNGKVSKK